MKNIFKFIIQIIISALFAGHLLAAGVNVAAKNIVDSSSTFSVDFGTITYNTGVKEAGQYLLLDFTGFQDAPLWQVDVHTDNSAFPGSEKGGLISLSNSSRLPVLWNADANIGLARSLDYRLLKDKNDKDFASLRQARGTAVCYGNTKKARIVSGKDIVSPLFIGLKCDFSKAAAGQYKGTIWFDLYPIFDVVFPNIQHQAYGKLMNSSNKMVFGSSVSGGEGIRWVKLHYKMGNGEWNVKEMQLSSSTAKCTLTQNELGSGNILYYYLEASDDFYDPAFWKSAGDPQSTEFVTYMQFLNVSSGEIIVPDTNPDDGATSINIPDGALDIAINISIRKLDIASLPELKNRTGSTKPVAAFEFTPHGTMFNKPVELTLLYNDENNDGVVEDADGNSTGIMENELKAYWWDGFSWRLMGGKVDIAANTVAFKTTHFSVFALFKSPGVTENDIRPQEKVFTPLASGHNSTMTFDGISDQSYTLNIYDISGRKARSISYPAPAIWDGRDDNGSVVESGVYIYQIETIIGGSKKLVSGTVSVAK